MKKIIPDEGTGIAPLGWYARNGQIMRAYGIIFQGEQIEVHMLDDNARRGALGEHYQPSACRPCA